MSFVRPVYQKEMNYETLCGVFQVAKFISATNLLRPHENYESVRLA